MKKITLSLLSCSLVFTLLNALNQEQVTVIGNFTKEFGEFEEFINESSKDDLSNNIELILTQIETAKLLQQTLDKALKTAKGPAKATLNFYRRALGQHLENMPTIIFANDSAVITPIEDQKEPSINQQKSMPSFAEQLKKAKENLKKVAVVSEDKTPSKLETDIQAQIKKLKKVTVTQPKSKPTPQGQHLNLTKALDSALEKFQNNSWQNTFEAKTAGMPKVIKAVYADLQILLDALEDANLLDYEKALKELKNNVQKIAEVAHKKDFEQRITIVQELAKKRFEQKDTAPTTPPVIAPEVASTFKNYIMSLETAFKPFESKKLSINFESLQGKIPTSWNEKIIPQEVSKALWEIIDMFHAINGRALYKTDRRADFENSYKKALAALQPLQEFYKEPLQKMIENIYPLGKQFLEELVKPGKKKGSADTSSPVIAPEVASTFKKYSAQLDAVITHFEKNNWIDFAPLTGKIPYPSDEKILPRAVVSALWDIIDMFHAINGRPMARKDMLKDLDETRAKALFAIAPLDDVLYKPSLAEKIEKIYSLGKSYLAKKAEELAKKNLEQQQKDAKKSEKTDTSSIKAETSGTAHTQAQKLLDSIITDLEKETFITFETINNSLKKITELTKDLDKDLTYQYSIVNNALRALLTNRFNDYSDALKQFNNLRTSQKTGDIQKLVYRLDAFATTFKKEVSQGELEQKKILELLAQTLQNFEQGSFTITDYAYHANLITKISNIYLRKAHTNVLSMLTALEKNNKKDFEENKKELEEFLSISDSLGFRTTFKNLVDKLDAIAKKRLS